MARVNVTSWLAVFLCCAVFVAIVGQSGITQTTATLSEARGSLAATSLGDLVFFGGGWNATGYESARVDIYNISSLSWTTATLSIPRRSLAATSSGNLVFFGGGHDNGSIPTVCSQVDIYNVSDGSWSTATLSQPRYFLVATSVGNLVLFGGGLNFSSWYNNVVDIYNATGRKWTTATLSQARYGLAATSVADRYALFAGGYNGSSVSNVVDIYDSLSGTWNTTTLSQGRNFLAAASVGNLAFFGGGDNGNSTFPSSLVDIYNSSSQEWSTATLSQNRTLLAAASSIDIVAFGGGYDGSTTSTVVDIFNVTSGRWSSTNLSQGRLWLAATSTNDTLLFGGGSQTQFSDPFAIVDIFQIPSMTVPSVLSAPSVPVSTVPLNVPNVPLNFTNSATLTPSQQDALSPFAPTVNTPIPSSLGPSTPPIGLIIGLIVGVLLLLLTGAIILILLMRRRRKIKKQKISEYPLVQPIRGTVVLESDATIDSTQTLASRRGTETTEALPCKITYSELEFGKIIGEGTYGRVCIGKWKNYRVALKLCQNITNIDEFLAEAHIMTTIPSHPNVVRIYGVAVDGTMPIIVLEYCPGGSLDKILYGTKEQISEKQKLQWIRDVAMGMRHLHQHNIIHRDLAARNILLSVFGRSGIAKISDFGMSRVLQQTEAITQKRIGPVCWMAPESIGQRIYSKKSDVWMFGVLIYEIISRREPHSDKDPNEVAIRVRDNFLTPEIPTNCPAFLKTLMQMCWNRQPEYRPSFDTICAMLEQAMQTYSTLTQPKVK
jgi:tRNA A-37 threonylcarbamoyl transferase component Bud32